MPGTLFSCLQEKVQENKGFQALRCSRADMGRWWLESGPSGMRWGQSPSFSCISCKPSPMRSPAAEQQAPLGYGQRPPPFAPGPVMGGGRQGHFSAAAVAGPSPALMGKGKAPSFLARLHGRLGIKS